MGGEVLMQHKVKHLEHEDGADGSGGRIRAVRARDPSGNEVRIEGEHFISTMPVRSLMRAMDPAPPAEFIEAGEGLKYRDFLVVALIIDKDDLFPDNWIYIHTPGVKVGRIQNFNNWSKAMVPEEGRTCIGMEYFCFKGDGLWNTSDEELIALGTKELGELGMVDPKLVVDGTVVRMPKAYPIYDSKYRAHLEGARAWIDPISNLHPVGAQRHAQIQQPGSLDAHVDDGRVEHAGGPARRLGSEHGLRVPRRTTGRGHRTEPTRAARSRRPLIRSAPCPRPHTVRSFNRFEFKYVVPHDEMRAFIDDLEGYTVSDRHSTGDSGYTVYSLYWDSPGLDFFWEKIDGQKYRRKLRLRRYTDGEYTFVEIKQRTDRTVQKRRMRLPTERVRALFRDGAIDFELENEGSRSGSDRGPVPVPPLRPAAPDRGGLPAPGLLRRARIGSAHNVRHAASV